MRSDEQLMLEFQAGTAKAFEELFARYRSPIYQFFRRRLDGTERAEDLTQETFIVILRKTERYEPRAKFRTYLYAIALKLLWSERRRQAREDRDYAEIPGLQPETSTLARLWIREALERLQPDYREVLMLREI